MDANASRTVEGLLRQAQAGDDGARGRLLELYRSYLTLLARSQIGRRLQVKVDAADVVQDVFLEAHRHFPQFRGGTEQELTRWLRQIMAASLANTVRRYCGTRGRDLRLERGLADDLDRSSLRLDGALLAKDSSPSQGAARREQAVLLADALERLPADYRDVLVLRHLEGLGFPEVAERLGRSVEAAKKLWARALDRLRRSFEAPA